MHSFPSIRGMDISHKRKEKERERESECYYYQKLTLKLIFPSRSLIKKTRNLLTKIVFSSLLFSLSLAFSLWLFFVFPYTWVIIFNHWLPSVRRYLPLLRLIWVSLFLDSISENNSIRSIITQFGSYELFKKRN